MREKSAFVELRALNNMMMRYIDKNFRSRDIDRMTVGNGWIIGYIYENRGKDVFQKDIEEQFSITRSTVSKVVDYMVGKGLIERQSVASDARLRKLVLTDKATEIVKGMIKNGDHIEKQMMNGFSAAEREQFISYLGRIRENISDKI